jgi:cell division septation protein DedD
MPTHRRQMAAVPQAARPAPTAASRGAWFVQVGAFRNMAVAQAGWARAVRRDAALRAHLPQGTAFQSGGGQVYRLSIGGFTRGAADATCQRYRALGGACFVRTGAGDRIAQWVRKDVQLASR